MHEMCYKKSDFTLIHGHKSLHLVLRLLGFDRLIKYALTEWLQDITKNQLPSILGGVGPMHSLVQIGQSTV